MWRLDPSLRSFTAISTPIPIKGFINSLQLLDVPPTSVDPAMYGVSGYEVKGKQAVLAAAVSQEPRLGRWMVAEEGTKNGVLVAWLRLDEAVHL